MSQYVLQMFVETGRAKLQGTLDYISDLVEAEVDRSHEGHPITLLNSAVLARRLRGTHLTYTILSVSGQVLGLRSSSGDLECDPRQNQPDEGAAYSHRWLHLGSNAP